MRNIWREEKDEVTKMSLAYGIIALVSLCMIGLCVAADKKRDVWLLLVFVPCPKELLGRPQKRYLQGSEALKR